jgi:hypothetical protein
MFRQSSAADRLNSSDMGAATLESSSNRLKIALSASFQKTLSSTLNLEAVSDGE